MGSELSDFAEAALTKVSWNVKHLMSALSCRTPGGTGGTNGGGTHLPAPGFFLGRSCTCRVRIELQSGELWAAGGLANACLHRKVFQERQSFDQLELQQLFLDLYRLYRPYSLSAHSLDTGTLVP